MLISASSIIVVLTALIAGGIFLFNRRLNTSSSWRALITPLASIMGSGFLVCAPLLYASIGNYAVFAMAGLLCLAYAIGGVIRFNIRYGEALFEKENVSTSDGREEHRLHVCHRNVACSVIVLEVTTFLEKSSHFVLAGAYCISVSYYLQLLASFGLQSLSISHAWYGKALVTVILTVIGIIGTVRGLKGIERLERTVVGINLAMIAALITGLIYHNYEIFSHGTWGLHHISIPMDKLYIVRTLMGILIIVQGFETSRFLGSEHSKEERIATMRWAQLISAAIYILFISVMAVVINNAGSSHGEGITAIIGLSKIVSPVLPILLTITAIGSQLSASTADDAGCSGLLEAILKGGKISRINYAIVSVAAIILTWLTDVYGIISYASRAFAFYYALQCVIAILVLRKVSSVSLPKIKSILFGVLAGLCALITLFGIPAG